MDNAYKFLVLGCMLLLFTAFAEAGLTDCYIDGTYYSSGSYVGDKYCQNGETTSRTQLIATQLMDLAQEESPNDYVLFCDEFRSALNYIDYAIGDNTAADYFVGYIDGGSPDWVCGGMDRPCVNNVCVLKLPNKVVFGASLNKPIHETPIPFIETLVDAPACQNEEAVTNDSQFHKCSSFKVWYNNKIQSVIYSKSDLSIGELSFWDKFLLFLRNPFQRMFDFLVKFLLSENTGQNVDYKFINSTSLYSRIYLARNGLKLVKGITERFEDPMNSEYLSVEYRCFTDSINKTVNVLDKRYRSWVPGYGYSERIISTYNSTLGTHYVVVSNSSPHGLPLWADLTAKLRIKDTGNYPDTKPVVRLSVSPAKAKVNERVTFTAEIDSCNLPHNYSLDYDDSSSLSGTAQLSFSLDKYYGSSGVYTPELSVFDPQNELGLAYAFVNITPLIGGLSCGILSPGTSCTGTVLFKMSAMENAHAERADRANYGYKVCCNLPGSTLSTTDPSGANVISLSADTNAHAAVDGSYTEMIRIFSPDANIRCRTTPICLSSESCVASVSSPNNAHVAQCGSYGTNICCRTSDNMCAVRNRESGCENSEEPILYLSDIQDAHASLISASTDFDKVLCCPDYYTIDDSCQAGIVSLSNFTDAHASAYYNQSNADTDFQNDVCIKAANIGETAECRYNESASCGDDEICVLSLSDIGDAHLGACGTWNKNICCKTS